MTIVLIAECGSREQAEDFLRPLKPLVWISTDGLARSEIGTELRQDGEGHWWGVVSTSRLDWTPISAGEANYRHLVSHDLQRWLTSQMLEGPAFRHTFVGEISPEQLKVLLASQDDDASSVRHLLGAPPAFFQLPDFLTQLDVAWIVSDTFWHELGSPTAFEPLVPGYRAYARSVRPSFSGGIEAPPEGVIAGTTMRIVVDPDQASALCDRAVDLTQSGDYQAALALLDQAQKLNPLSPDVHFDKAVALYFSGQFPEALQSLQSTLMTNPSNGLLVLLYQLRGDTLRAQGKPEDALAAYEESLRLGPPIHYLLHPLRQRAELLIRLDRTDEARAACDAALVVSPDDTDLLALRSQLSPCT